METRYERAEHRVMELEFAVIDTDVVSYLFKGDTRGDLYQPHLDRKRGFIPSKNGGCNLVATPIGSSRFQNVFAKRIRFARRSNRMWVRAPRAWSAKGLELQPDDQLHNTRIARIADCPKPIPVSQCAVSIERQIGGCGIGQTGEVDRAVNSTELGVVEGVEGVSA